MKNVLIAVISVLIAASCLSACEDGNKKIADNTAQEEYYTQTSMSALEYKMYLANKISVAVGQLSTHMAKIQNVAGGSCSFEDEIDALETAIKTLKDDRKDMTYVYPPDSYSSTRENALQYWQDAIDKMQEMSDFLDGKTLSAEKALEFSTDLKDIYTSIQSLNFSV